MMKKIIQWIVLTVVVLLSAVVRAQPADTIPSKEMVFPKIGYDWVSYQMKVALNKQDTPLSFQCFFVNRIDSLIYLNLNRSGIELARVVLTPDSIIYVNKLDHQFYAGNYRFLEKIFGFPLDFAMVQSLLNGVDFTNFEDNLQRVDDEGRLYFVAPQRRHQTAPITLMQSIELNQQGQIINNDITDLATRRDFDISYENHTEIAGIPFFQRLLVEMDADEVELKVDIKNIKFNQSGPTAIRIPNNFTEIE